MLVSTFHHYPYSVPPCMDFNLENNDASGSCLPYPDSKPSGNGPCYPPRHIAHVCRLKNVCLNINTLCASRAAIVDAVHATLVMASPSDHVLKSYPHSVGVTSTLGPAQKFEAPALYSQDGKPVKISAQNNIMFRPSHQQRVQHGGLHLNSKSALLRPRPAQALGSYSTF